MTYGGRKHLRIGAYEDMWDRTLSIYSPGKVKLEFFLFENSLY